MNHYDDEKIERMLESTDLSDRSRIRTSLRRDLLERGGQSAPRTAWAFNAFALGIMAIGVIAFMALVLGGGGGVAPGAGSTEEASVPNTDASPTPPPFPTLVPIAHTVQEGESLRGILAMYGYDPNDPAPIEQVLAMNGLASEEDIQVGQVLLIPPRVVEPPFDPCPPGTIIDIPPTIVADGTPMPEITTATAFPTIPPCDPGTAYPGGSGDFGPNSATTATPLPFDPNAPTVPPMASLVPTPTAMNDTVLTVDEASQLTGIDVVEPLQLPAGYTLDQRRAHANSIDSSSVITSWTRTEGTQVFYISLNQYSAALPLDEVMANLGVEESQGEAVSIGEDDVRGLWFADWDTGAAGGTVSSIANMMIWNQDGSTFYMVAHELTREQMIAFAESLQ